MDRRVPFLLPTRRHRTVTSRDSLTCIKSKEADLKHSILIAGLVLTVVVQMSAQSGSINNTLGSGGTFTVKNSSGNPLVVVDEATGQLTADRVKVDGVPSFTAYLIGASGITSGDTLDSWTEGSGYGSHDNSGGFNVSTGEFTAPRNGFYFFSAGVELTASASGVTLYIYVDNQYTSLAARQTLVGMSGTNLSTSGILKLNSGDIVTLRLTASGLSGTISTGLGWFSGYLVSDL